MDNMRIFMNYNLKSTKIYIADSDILEMGYYSDKNEDE